MKKTFLLASLALVCVGGIIYWWCCSGRIEHPSTAAGDFLESRPVFAVPDTESEVPEGQSTTVKSLQREELKRNGGQTAPRGELRVHTDGLRPEGPLVWILRQKDEPRDEFVLSTEANSSSLAVGYWEVESGPPGWDCPTGQMIYENTETVFFARKYRHLNVIVQTKAGSAIPGAIVRWSLVQLNTLSEEPKVIGKADASGVAIVSIAPRSGNLIVSCHGFAERVIKIDDSQGGIIPVVLLREDEISYPVQVKDALTGEVIPGITISSNGLDHFFAVTNEKGIADVQLGGKWGWSMDLSGSGYARIRIDFRKQQRIVLLRPSAMLHVYTFFDNKEAIRRTVINLRNAYPGEEGLFEVTDRSDDYGHCNLVVPVGVPLLLSAKKSGFLQAEKEIVVSHEGLTERVFLGRVAPLFLRTVSWDGELLDAQVEGKRRDGTKIYPSQEEQGLYRFDSPGGIVDISVFRPGYIAIRGHRRGRISEESLSGGSVTIQMAKGETIQGRINWDDGTIAEMEKFTIQESVFSMEDVTEAKLERDLAEGWRWIQVPCAGTFLTNRFGEFQVTSMEPGQWQIDWITPLGENSFYSVKTSILEPFTFAVPSPSPLEVVLPRFRFISIAAADAVSGSSVPDFDVFNTANDYVPQLSGPQSSEGQGFFRGWIKVKDFTRLEVRADGYQSLLLALCERLVPQRGITHYKARLEPLGKIGFIIHVPDGVVEPFRITLSLSEEKTPLVGLPGCRWESDLITNTEGKVVFVDIPNCDYPVSVRLRLTEGSGRYLLGKNEISVTPGEVVEISVIQPSK